jgi:ATP-dependent DNA helicase RecG
MDVREITKEEAEVVLAYEESHFLDVKAKAIGAAKVSQTVSAFCNTAGGEIFIGISEGDVRSGRARSWDGFRNQEDANGVIQGIEALLPLGGFYRAQFLSCSEYSGYVLHLVIFKTREIVKSSDGTVYIRRGAQKLSISDETTLARLKLDKGIESFEDSTLNISEQLVANSVTILEFLLDVVPTAEPEQWLKSQLLLYDDKPTVAAAMLFADEPQALLPKRSAIKIFQFRTNDEGVNRETLAFTPLTIEGPVYDLIDKAVTTAKEIVEGIKRLGEQGLEEISYPDETLHEIITNAVLHRDYSLATDIQIRIYDDRIEVESPGKLPGHVTTANVLDEQFARNPKIVRLINKFPDPPNKDVGEGLNTAFQAMRRIRLKDPEIVEKENSVVVFIRHTRLSSPEQIVTEYLETNETITNQIGRQITGIRRDVQMKDVFVRLRNKDVIEQVPGKRGRATAWRKRE